MITIYTDGSNTHNGKEYSYGGYAYIIEYGSSVKIEHGDYMLPNKDCPVTNNRAELMAILESLSVSLDICTSDKDINEINLYTDSQWCLKCATKEWSRKKNKDLWNIYNQLEFKLKMNRIKVNFHWVKGHNGNELNERVDKLAKEFNYKAKELSSPI